MLTGGDGDSCDLLLNAVFADMKPLLDNLFSKDEWLVDQLCSLGMVLLLWPLGFPKTTHTSCSLPLSILLRSTTLKDLSTSSSSESSETGCSFHLESTFFFFLPGTIPTSLSVHWTGWSRLTCRGCWKG